METASLLRERRKVPRVSMDLPLEYRVANTSSTYGGFVLNASEKGLLIHSNKNIPVGTRLHVVLFFTRGFEFANIEGSAEIIWKDLSREGDREGFRYGLKFIQIFLDEDRWKLRQLLSNPPPIEA